MPSQYPSSEFGYSAAQIALLKNSISQLRFDRYLALAQGNERIALHPYERNTIFSECLYGVLQGFEVMLRNSMHTVMTDAYEDEFWFDRVNLSRLEAESVAKARGKIMTKGRPVTAPRIVAELTFGFWCALTARDYASALWLPHLYKAFPFKRLGHRIAFSRLNSIRTLRNMVAHHECILGRDTSSDYREIIECASWICPGTTSWIRHTCRFEGAHRLILKREAIGS